MTSISAVIFDMDGLLIDTERSAKIAWKTAAEIANIEISDKLLDSLVGRHIDDCLDILNEKLNRDLRAENFIEKVDDIYFSNFMRHGIQVKNGAVDLLQILSDIDFPRAVATSSEQHIAPRKLRLAGLEHYFPTIVTGCEVKMAKPDPEIFQLTAEKLNIDPSECLVLEDSYNGIRGALQAGMQAIMIPDMLEPTEEMESLTLGIYASIDEALPAILEMCGIER